MVGPELGWSHKHFRTGCSPMRTFKKWFGCVCVCVCVSVCVCVCVRLTLSFSSCSLFLASTLAFFSDSFLAFSSSLNLFIRGSRLYAVSVHTHTHPHTPPLPCSSSPLLRKSSILPRSEEHTSELQSQLNLVCRLLLEERNAGTGCEMFCVGGIVHTAACGSAHWY